MTAQFTMDRAIVATPRKNRKELLKELATAVAELRQDAKAKGLDKMPMTRSTAPWPAPGAT